jgi:hypothetical protein
MIIIIIIICAREFRFALCQSTLTDDDDHHHHVQAIICDYADSAADLGTGSSSS